MSTSNFNHNVFLEILQDIENLLFWVLWTCLATPTKMKALTFREMFICMQKTKIIRGFFLGILQRYWKLVILDTLGMGTHRHPIYIHVKDQLYHSPFPWDIAKILQTCCFGYLGYAWPPPTVIDRINFYENLMFMSMQKIISIPLFFLGVLYLKESCNLIGEVQFGPYLRN